MPFLLLKLTPLMVKYTCRHLVRRFLRPFIDRPLLVLCPKFKIDCKVSWVHRDRKLFLEDAIIFPDDIIIIIFLLDHFQHILIYFLTMFRMSSNLQSSSSSSNDYVASSSSSSSSSSLGESERLNSQPLNRKQS